MKTLASNDYLANEKFTYEDGRVSEKRTEMVSVRLTPRDLESFKEAANILWPGAVLTQSGIVLGLARLMADKVKKSGPRK